MVCANTPTHSWRELDRLTDWTKPPKLPLEACLARSSTVGLTVFTSPDPTLVAESSQLESVAMPLPAIQPGELPHRRWKFQNSTHFEFQSPFQVFSKSFQSLNSNANTASGFNRLKRLKSFHSAIRIACLQSALPFSLVVVLNEWKGLQWSSMVFNGSERR